MDSTGANKYDIMLFLLKSRLAENMPDLISIYKQIIKVIDDPYED